MPTKKSLLHCSAAVVRSTLNPPRCPQPSGVLNRLPEASDFSQRVRHLNSVSREAETLTSELRHPASSLRQACAKRPRHCASPFLTTKMAPWTSKTFLCWPKIRLSVPIFAVSVALGATFERNCAQLNKNDVCWTHFCRHDAL